MARRSVRPRTVALAASLALLAGGGLTGCAQSDTAAMVDGRRISETEVLASTDQIARISGPQGAPTPSMVVSALILAPMINEEAARGGRAGSDAAARAQLAETGIEDPTQGLLEIQKAQAAQQRLTPAQVEALTARVRDAEITVNPRYGTLDRSKMQLAPADGNWIDPDAAQPAPELTPAEGGQAPQGAQPEPGATPVQ